MNPLIFKADEIDFTIEQIAYRTEPENILLCTPDHFNIIDEKNIHMRGNIGSIDKAKAMRQWTALKNVYDDLKQRNILKEVSIISGAENCEDMVFCANQTFPWQKENGDRIVVMSNMRHASRQKEVAHFEKFFQQKGFTPVYISGDLSFEGMGDVIPHPEKQLLYGGYGHRTNVKAYEQLSEILDAPVIALELINPSFYHLDTCFVPLSLNSVMLCKEAFSNEGLAIIEKLFEKIYEVPENEAEQYFSLNAHVLAYKGYKVAILQEGSTITKNILIEEGYEVIELNTSEFMRSGGSVFCMKMMYNL